MNRAVIGVIAAVIVVALGGAARAYPQFQLSRDQTCSGCHLSPAGGSLLSENGFATAEAISQFPDAPEFSYNKFKLPSWLALGGDLRTIYGYMRAPQEYLVWFPMQLDAYASAKLPSGFRVHLTVGYRPSEYGNEAATHVWSREHYVQWQLEPDTSEGLFVRVGRFMPVFGQRFVEHPYYSRRWGGTPLYYETYGAAVEYVTNDFEVHATGFIRDPLIDPVGHDNGGALYAEVRPMAELALGAEAMITVSPDDKKYRGGITAKYYAKPAELLLSAEGQVVNQHIETFGLTQLVGQLVASKFVGNAIMIDLALEHFDENIRIKSLDRDAIDLNVHWFIDSHTEAVLMGRVELINQGRALAGNLGGPSGGYALLQLHYRL